jgi:predicted ATPase/DNA-binding SARP family transcriptional activator
MRVQVRLLGRFEVVVDGRPVPPGAWRRRDAAALVKLLALSPGHRLMREQVLDALWPDLLVEQAAQRLHKAAHYARTSLGARDGVVLEGDAVALFPHAELHAELSVDVDDFDAAATAARSGETGPAAEALQLYSGDLLPDDLYEPWTEQPREVRRLRCVQLLRVVGQWERVLEADPLDEEAHLQLASEHLQRGDRRAALAQLDRMEEVLEHELGTGPSAAATALRAQVLALPPGGLRWEVQAARRAPVPAPPTATVGRVQETRDVVDLLRRVQVVTLLGPGGVGKTRLAMEVALRWRQAVGEEACYVDLTRAADAASVPATVARSLGVDLAATGDVEGALEEALGGRTFLLVLDNFEHVVGAAAVVGLIAACSPGIRMLSTSRARLRVSGEHIVDVPPLSLEHRPQQPGQPAGTGDAVALFEQAATAVDPGFRLAPYVEDVDSICRMVDGLPLAIELAAGHVRTLSPPLLRARLHARLGSPTGASRDLPARQQTIPTTIDWSLQLLGEAERQLFVRLGVFAGAVPLGVVEGICADPGTDLLDALARLVDQSLVRRITDPQQEPRFGLLELLRERARELLTGAEELLVRDRHAAFMTDFLDDLEDRRWHTERRLDLLIDRLPEIRAAHDWAEQRRDTVLAARMTAGLGDYWHREGHHAEGRAWVGAALAHQDELDDHLVARLHLAAGVVEFPRDPSVARQHWERAVDAFRTLGHDRYLAYSMALAAVSHVGEADTYDAAVTLCDEGIELARRAGELTLTARALNMKGELARVHGDDALALAAYEEGRALAAATHDDANLAIFLGNLSFLAEHRGDYSEARRLSLEALRLRWTLGRRMMAGWSLAELAGAELGLGHAELGARLIGAADGSLSMAGVDRHPCDVPEYDRVVAGLRRELGPDHFDRLRSEGASLPLDDAVALALTDPGDPGQAAPVTTGTPR